MLLLNSARKVLMVSVLKKRPTHNTPIGSGTVQFIQLERTFGVLTGIHAEGAYFPILNSCSCRFNIYLMAMMME